MHTIVKNISCDAREFQSRLDSIIDDLCNRRGYQMMQMSNLVESIDGSSISSSKVPGGFASERRQEYSNTIRLSQTFLFVKNPIA